MSSLSFTSTGQTPLVFSSFKPIQKGLTPQANEVVQRTAGDVASAYTSGIDASLITLTFDWTPTSKHPLKRNDYEGGWNYSSRTQASSTQSLLNWFWNVAHGEHNTFIMSYTDALGNVINQTVRWLDDAPKFTPLPNGHFEGVINLRIEY